MRIATSLLLACVLGGVAAADNKVEVLDRGNAVEIIAHDMKAASTAITPVRSRLEIAVVGTPSISNGSTTDKTVKTIEVTGRDKRNLSVKLGFERPEVAALAKFAQAVQVGNDLHIIVPRIVPVAGQAFDLPEPTLSPEIAAKAAAMTPAVTLPTTPVAIAPIAEVKPVEPKVEPKLEAKTEAKTEPTVAVAKPAEPKLEPKKVETKPIAGAKEPGASKNFPAMIAILLASVGCFAWMKRKKKPAMSQVSSIEIIAQKSLGGKAKVVWLSAGGREIVVSVTPQAVRVLGQWKKTGESGAPSMAMDVRPSGRIPLPEATALNTNAAPASPAVAGILKLRARTHVPQINEDIATDDVDADAIWAKEILAATTGARR